MIRGFVAGNLIVGSVMAAATTLVLWSVGMKGAVPLGIASGLLNLLPFTRTDRCTCSSSCSGPPSVQHTGTIHRHRSHGPLPTYRIRERSYSEIHCHSREYWAG